MADLYKRLESHQEIPPKLEETSISLEQLLENNDEDEDDVISLEDDQQKQAPETPGKQEKSVEPDSLHLNGGFSVCTDKRYKFVKLQLGPVLITHFSHEQEQVN